MQVKILKKHDKRTGLLLRAPYLANVLQQPFYSTSIMSRMVRRAEEQINALVGLQQEQLQLQQRRLQQQQRQQQITANAAGAGGEGNEPSSSASECLPVDTTVFR